MKRQKFIVAVGENCTSVKRVFRGCFRPTAGAQLQELDKKECPGLEDNVLVIQLGSSFMTIPFDMYKKLFLMQEVSKISSLRTGLHARQL